MTDTRKLFRFSLGTHNQENKKKIKKIEKEKNQKNGKGKKSKKLKKSKREKEKRLFAVVSDKMCVFCLYPILDSQQCVKRGSCRRPILSGLLFRIFNFC